mmetsp:Transcript_66365/g.194251  ORF Transcript_66365/g.194251 Transcript_66365/m.194251 type:complete len:194 (+) Transcript_66365:1253-1834(+)
MGSSDCVPTLESVGPWSGTPGSAVMVSSTSRHCVVLLLIIGRLLLFRRVLLPVLWPALLTAAGGGALCEALCASATTAALSGRCSAEAMPAAATCSERLFLRPHDAWRGIFWLCAAGDLLSSVPLGSNRLEDAARALSGAGHLGPGGAAAPQGLRRPAENSVERRNGLQEAAVGRVIPLGTPVALRRRRPSHA